jgi:serine/threonine protein kinase
MGEVYRAHDTTLNRDVAIKILQPGREGDDRSAKRLLREAQSAAALDHPNICTVYEVSHADGYDFIAMQFVDGQTLADRLAAAPLSPADALAIAAQIADALADAHRHGIVHRDIKPANIMLTAGGRVKVLDFGLAKSARPHAAEIAGAAIGGKHEEQVVVR